VRLFKPLPNPPWFRAVKAAFAIVLLVLAIAAIVAAFMIEDLFVIGVALLTGGASLGLFAVSLLISSLSRPKPVGDVPPVELQVTPQKTRVYQVGLVAMLIAIVLAPFAYFLHGAFTTLLQLSAAVFCGALIYASHKVRCPHCGAPLPFEVARRAVGTHVPSWRPKCPRCRVAI
jgi:hypothetical protein